MKIKEIESLAIVSSEFDRIEEFLIDAQLEVVNLQRAGVWIVSGNRAVLEVLDDNPSFGVSGLQRPLAKLSQRSMAQLERIPFHQRIRLSCLPGSPSLRLQPYVRNPLRHFGNWLTAQLANKLIIVLRVTVTSWMRSPA